MVNGSFLLVAAGLRGRGRHRVHRLPCRRAARRRERRGLHQELSTLHRHLLFLLVVRFPLSRELRPEAPHAEQVAREVELAVLAKCQVQVEAERAVVEVDPRVEHVGRRPGAGRRGRLVADQAAELFVGIALETGHAFAPRAVADGNALPAAGTLERQLPAALSRVKAHVPEVEALLLAGQLVGPPQRRGHAGRRALHGLERKTRAAVAPPSPATGTSTRDRAPCPCWADPR